PVTYFFMQLPRWETNYGPHLDLFHKVQSFRSDILSCELVDANAFAYLDREDQLGVEQDIIFLEVKTSGFEKIFEELLTKLEGIDEESIFEISEENFHNIRAKVPRAIFESNSKSGVLKMGTDVQVLGKDFQKLMDHYRAASQVGVEYNLFGHFGDAHLHFNFMPKPDEIDQCISYFKTLYADVCKWEGSPFAEHGIGIIKQKYITPFYNENHKVVFEFLKNKMDPNGQFFPQGFMSK
ncbi:MAG: FAD/FMN-containing dehydrogenase, partial [Thermoproteota archaeon]